MISSQNQNLPQNIEESFVIGITFDESFLKIFAITLTIEYGIFGEGSHISTNQKRENSASSLLIGGNLRPFPEKKCTLYLVHRRDTTGWYQVVSHFDRKPPHSGKSRCTWHLASPTGRNCDLSLNLMFYNQSNTFQSSWFKSNRTLCFNLFNDFHFSCS